MINAFDADYAITMTQTVPFEEFEIGHRFILDVPPYNTEVVIISKNPLIAAITMLEPIGGDVVCRIDQNGEPGYVSVKGLIILLTPEEMLTHNHSDVRKAGRKLSNNLRGGI